MNEYDNLTKNELETEITRLENSICKQQEKIDSLPLDSQDEDYGLYLNDRIGITEHDLNVAYSIYNGKFD